MGKNYDFIATGSPVNGTASRVLQKGEHYEPQIRIDHAHSRSPLPGKDFEGEENDNLVGRIFGRFTVVGYAGRKRPKKAWMVHKDYLWVVRCSCGDYETRWTRSFLNKKNVDDKCAYCDELAYLRKNERWRRTGSYE